MKIAIIGSGISGNVAAYICAGNMTSPFMKSATVWAATAPPRKSIIMVTAKRCGSIPALLYIMS